MNLSIGQKSKLKDLSLSDSFVVSLKASAPVPLDFACFGLNSNQKLHSDPWMVFYNQPDAPNSAVRLSLGNVCQFSVNLGLVPSDIDRLVFTATSDSNPMSSLSLLEFNVGESVASVSGSSFSQEKAIIVGELYRKDGEWRLAVVCQGFNGGLSALLAHFGGEEATSASPTPAPPIDLKKKVFLEKRLSLAKDLERSAPKLLDLSKKAAISLEKRNLGEHKAKVAICLDISASMSSLYSSGIVQQFVERILALGCRLDDDGSIDVFLFGEQGYKPEDITVKDFSGYIPNLIREFPLEYDTKYAKAMELVRRHYVPNYSPNNNKPSPLEYPVYVMFVTDGAPSDKQAAIQHMTSASFEPIFWQFMGVGGGSFSFLEKLDDLSGRFVDNADFFSVKSLNSMSDDQLFDKLMNEYPAWLKQVTAKGLVPVNLL